MVETFRCVRTCSRPGPRRIIQIQKLAHGRQEAGENRDQENAALRARVRQLEQEAVEGRQAKGELQNQIHFLQTLIDTIPNPVFYKNTSGVYLGCNKAFERRLGKPREEIIGRRAEEALKETLDDLEHRVEQRTLEPARGGNDILFFFEGRG